MKDETKEQRKPKGKCQFGEHSALWTRCDKPATHKWGEYWFCHEHGSRRVRKEDDTPTKK